MKSRFAHSLLLAAFAIAMTTWGGAAFAQQNKPDTQQPSTPSQPDTTAPSQSPTEPPQSPQTTPGQTQPGQTPDQTAPSQKPDRTPSATPSGDTQEFVGTVVKQGNKYVFQDAATGTTYDIDHQDEVAKFDGKKVRVHGTLDPNGKMIHVQ